MKRYTHDLETDLNDVDKTPSLIHKTLLTASTIYDLKYLAQVLNDAEFTIQVQQKKKYSSTRI